MMNRVLLVGRLTKDPELRYTPNGVAVTTFRLACNRPFKNQNGDNEADFINVVVWRRAAENCASFLHKGSLAGVDGRVQTRNFEGQDGKTVFVTEVVAESVQFLEPKNSNNNKPNGNNNYENSNSNNYNQGSNNNQFGDGNYKDPFANAGEPIDISDDDLPF
ncbi:single-stranded DNA-binding protein [Virgibacillus halodenitrificans]|uniref:single-stranded DNA-binding protein n=1 Tax=Virgibacillus halodenitrificans TaxID=1482 RepID=UPI000EF4A6FE|nr:single-stranded DNA-binding protein [Virgibacillus halodenitrificans]